MFVQLAFDECHQGHRPARELGLGADPFGEVEGFVKGLVENTAEETGIVCGLVRLFGLSGDLRLTDHH